MSYIFVISIIAHSLSLLLSVMDSFIIMVIVIIENIDTIIVGISFRYLYYLTFFVIFIAIASNEL